MSATAIDPTWLKDFDAELERLYCVDHNDIGMDDDRLLRWCDLPPYEAALQLGEKYDLIRFSPWMFERE